MRRLTRHDKHDLRVFGLTLGAFVLVVFGLLIPWWRDAAWSDWALWGGASVAALALAWPVAVWPIYAVLRPVLLLLATINTWLLLGGVYFLLVTPFGWALRRLNRLQYTASPDRSLATYRVRSLRDGGKPLDLDKPF
jgi:hypothetical protein